MAEPVGIVGASVAGLALACGLAAHGVPSVVFDQQAPRDQDQAPALLGPRALEALSRWGVAAALRRSARCLRRLRILYRGRPLGFLSTSDLPTRQAVVASMELGRLRQVLARQALATGLVDLRPPARVIGLQGLERRARILLEDGSTASFRFLAAACPDLRRYLGIRLVVAPEVGPTWCGQACLAPQDELVLHLGASGMACSYPREGGPAAVAAEAWAPGVDLPRFREDLRLSEDFGLQQGSAGAPSGVAAALVVGPVALLGAGARSLPAGAWRSRDLDVLEAEALAWRLAAVGRGAPQELLVGYDSERRPRSAAREALGPTWLPRLCHPEVARFLGTFLQSRLLRRRLAGALWGLAGAYRPSSWCLDERPGRRPAPPIPGMRLPEVRFQDAAGQRRWLHDLLGREPLVLRFGDGQPQAGWRISRRACGPGLLFDADGSLGRALRGRAGEVMIVRPDGVVGYRAWPEDPRRTAAWLATLGAP